MIWKDFIGLHKKVIVSVLVGVFVPSVTAFAIATSSQYNQTVKSSSTSSNPSSFNIVSDISSITNDSVIASNSVNSKAQISSSVSPSQGGDNVTDDIDKIQQATNDGIDKINSATSQAIDKINSTVPDKPASSSAPSSKTPINVYGIPDPNNRKAGISPIEGDRYQQVKKMYNDYAAQKGVAQDAGDIEPYKSQAILKWLADHPIK